MEERRCHNRYYVKALKSRLRESHFFGFLTKPTPEEYLCLDISEGGLQFVAQKGVKSQTWLLLDIFTPFTKKDPLRIKARVAWVKTLFNFRSYIVGVQFVSMGKSQQRELKILIATLGKDKNKIPQNIRVKMIQEASGDRPNAQIQRQPNQLTREHKIKKDDIDWKG